VKTESLWRLTFDPAGTPQIFCNYRRVVSGVNVRGDWVEGELRIPLQRGVEVVDLVDSLAPFLRLLGNDKYVFTLDVWEDKTANLVVGSNTYGPDIAARVAMMDFLIAMSATGRKPLNVEITGYVDHYWQFASCVISAAETARVLETSKFRILRSYSMICTGLSKKTGVPT